MALSVEIDNRSGFCGGVIQAIEKAEKFLADNPGVNLYSLGDMVHNEAELARLRQKGLVSLDADDLDETQDAAGRTLLIRAHGEPPVTYSVAKLKGFNIVDCTCPVVLKLQKKIREAYTKLHQDAFPGQIVIFGKIGHAEVLGLVGQVCGDAVVVENMQQLQDALEQGKISTNRNIELFSQTTMDPVEYFTVHRTLAAEMSGGATLNVHETICSQVASRHDQLSNFARNHDIIIFVSGKASSNGKVLCALCKKLNIRTFHITGPKDLNRTWFRADDRVGVCGATSTPKWLLEEVATTIYTL